MATTDFRQYNPEGSRLRTHQKELAELLKVFADVCKEHNIQWWLCSGTLLGAARHKGFIPWDDDVDVAMMKKDYWKLRKVMQNWEDKRYYLHTMENDIEYKNAFGHFAYKENETVICFDVFPMEKSSRFAAHMAKFFYCNMHHPSKYIKNKWLRHFYTRLVQAISFGLLIPFTRLIGYINPKKQYHYILGSGFWKSAFYAEDIFPLSEMEFEGHMFPVPGDTNAYLTKIYGDWTKMPSEEQIKKSIHGLDYYKEIFG